MRRMSEAALRRAVKAEVRRLDRRVQPHLTETPARPDGAAQQDGWAG